MTPTATIFLMSPPPKWSKKKRVVREVLGTHGLARNHINDGSITRFQELGAVFQLFPRMMINLLLQPSKLAADSPLSFTWGSGCGEIAQVQGRPWTSSFIKCSSLSRRWEALSFTVFLMFQPRAICLLMFFLLRVSTLLLPQSWLTSLQVTVLQEIPMSLPKTSVLFASSFFRCCSLLNTLKATSPN